MRAKDQLIRFIVEEQILKLGDFITNSGRKTPYFCNFGDLSDPLKLEYLCSIYADKIIEKFGSSIDNVFGPSYKGITLAVMTAHSLSQKLGKTVSFTFNRKEAKDHGEKGLFIGHSYKGDEKVVIVEDVLTSGKSLRGAYELLEGTPCHVLGSIVCVDRQEKDLEKQEKAKLCLEKEQGKPLVSLLTIEEILNFLCTKSLSDLPLQIDPSTLGAIENYRSSYLA